jgi:GTP cyclohydrolase I
MSIQKKKEEEKKEYEEEEEEMIMLQKITRYQNCINKMLTLCHIYANNTV